MRGKTLRVFGLVGCGIALWLGGSPAFGALDGCLSIRGAEQGPIAGDFGHSRCADLIAVVEYHHLVRRPVEGGALEHETVIFTKAVDRATVNLWRALNTGEELTLSFEFWRPSASGQETHFYTVELSGARIVAIEPWMLYNKNPANMQHPESERIRVEYRQITIRYLGGAEPEFETLTP